MKKILEVQNLTKIYKIYKKNSDRLKELFSHKTYHKEFIANKNNTFDLYTGETLGIVGINGAGKSTLLKMIAGVISSTSGSINKQGHLTALLELGTGFNKEATGHENIYLNGSLIGMSKTAIKKVLQDIINFSELGDSIEQPIRTYSSGMKMRLAFSIALYSEPEILIVDEALSVGDAHFSAKCTRALKQRKEKNMSIIYVSHDLNSLKVLCDRVIMIHHGEIVQQGTPESVINRYNYLISQLNDNEEKINTDSKKQSSFGTFAVIIEKVTIVGEKTQTDVINAGENSIIDVFINAQKDLKEMTIGILIRDRLGQDIFGTNTYYHKTVIDFIGQHKYRCRFTMPLNIGIGKYSITAAVHSQENHLSNCSHWLDHATSFEIAGIIGPQFIGLSKLDPQIIFKKIESL